MSNIGKTLHVGLFWSVVQILVKRFFDFFVKLVLLNILFPEEFGIVTMATAFSSAIYVISDFGFKTALVQRKEKELFDSHYSSVFWFGLVWSLLVFLIVYFIGTPLIVDFYKEPFLYKIIPILTIPIITEALTVIHRVKILRALSFKKIAFIQTTSILVSGVIALVMAKNGAGIWSLVVYLMLPFVFALPLNLIIISWIPRFVFCIKHLREIIRFSVFTFLTALIIVISLNIDYLFIGKFMDATDLGIYNLAFMFTILLGSQITSMIDRVMFPFYSRFQKDISLVKTHYLNSLLYYSTILYPIMLVLMIFSLPIIILFFDEKWIDAATSMKILAGTVLIRLLTQGSTLVYRSLGKPKLEMNILFFPLFLVGIPAIYLGSFYGINGISKAILFSSMINLFISLYFLNRELSITFKDIILNLKAPILGFILSLFIVLPLFYYTSIHSIVLIVILLLIYGNIIYYYHGSQIIINIKTIFVNKDDID